MKIPLKAVTVTYTRTLTLSPTSQMFEDWDGWDGPPDQEDFESLAIRELFYTIHDEMGGPANPMPYTDVRQFEDVEIEWEGWDNYPYDDQKMGYGECWAEDFAQT